MTSGEGGETPSLLTLNVVVVAVVVVVFAFDVVFVLLAFHDVGGCSAGTSWEGRVTQSLRPDDDDQEDFVVALHL